VYVASVPADSVTLVRAAVAPDAGPGRSNGGGGGGEGKWLINGLSTPKADRDGDTPLVLLCSSEDIEDE